MKMKQSKAVAAYISLIKISKEMLPAKTAMELFRLKGKLTPQWDFQREQEELYVDKYAIKDQSGDGTIRFESEELRDKFTKAMSDVDNTDVDIEFDRVRVETKDFKLSISDIEALEGFVEFVD